MDKPFEIGDAFCLAVGRMTIAWAMIEIPLDLVSGILFTRANGAQKYEKQIPRAFERKAEFCKKCFNNLPELSTFKPGAPSLIQDACDLAEERHRLIHGIVDNFTPVAEGKIILRRIRYEVDRHTLEEHHTSIDEIASATNRAIATGGTMTALATTLADHFGIRQHFGD